MSQWRIREGVEFEIMMDDVEFQEKYEKAFRNMGESEKALQKVGSMSEITRGYCQMFYKLYDDIFGEGSGEKIFEGKMNVTLCNKVYDSFIEHCQAESKRILSETQKMANRYKPKKGKR